MRNKPRSDTADNQKISDFIQIARDLQVLHPRFQKIANTIPNFHKLALRDFDDDFYRVEEDCFDAAHLYFAQTRPTEVEHAK